MPLLDILKDLVIITEERYFGENELKEASRFVSEFIRHNAKKEVLIVAGKLMYSADALEDSLYRTGPAKIIFGGKSTEEFMAENIELRHLLEEGKLELYRLEEYPTYCYACIDGKTLVVERVHKPEETPDIYFAKSGGSYAKKYRKRFYELLKKAEPVK